MRSGTWSPPSAIAITAIGTLVFLAGIAEAFARKRVAGDNPWGEGATTLEWTLSSPPPFHQFETLPDLRGKYGNPLTERLTRLDDCA